MKDKRAILLAMAVFLGTAMLAVVVNSLVKAGWHWDYSISRYVGLELWSSLLFCLGNCLVGAIVGRYLWQIGENWSMPKIYYVMIVVMVVSLIGLSACPLGICDPIQQIDPVSHLHRIFSRLMFLMMTLVVLTLGWRNKIGKKWRFLATGYAVYGAVCAWGMLVGASWLENEILGYETIFFVLFMGFLGIFPMVPAVKKK